MPLLKVLLPEIDLLKTELQVALNMDLSPQQARTEAISAWNAGLATLTVQFCARATPDMQLLQAIALNRLGEPEQALEVLQPLSGALAEVHRASSLWQLGDLGQAQQLAEQALILAREEGQSSAILSGVCILGEVLLEQGQFKKAVVTLAEAFKVAEIIGEEADPYALAITAEAHILWGSHNKARQTVEKVLSRTQPYQLAWVRARISEGRMQPLAYQDALKVAQVLDWGCWESRIQRMQKSGQQE